MGETELGNYIRQRLKEIGMSGREAARRMGISHSYFFNVVTGRIKRPGPGFCRNLAGVLGVSTITILRIAGHLPYDEEDDAVVEELRPMIEDPLFLEFARQYVQLPEMAQRVLVAIFREILGNAAFRYMGRVYVKPVGRGIVLEEAEGGFLETAVPPGNYQALIVLRPADDGEMERPGGGER